MGLGPQGLDSGVGAAGTPPAEAGAQVPAQEPQTQPDPSQAPQSEPQQTDPSPQTQDPSWLAPRLQREREKARAERDAELAAEKDLADFLRSQGVDPREAVRLARQQADQAAAQAAGVPLPVYEKMTALERQLAELQAQQQNARLGQEESDLSRQHPDYAQHRDQARALAAKHNLSLEHAYFLATREAQMQRTRLEAEQQTLANVTGRDSRATERVNAQGAPPQKPDIRDRSAVPDEEIERMFREIVGRR